MSTGPTPGARPKRSVKNFHRLNKLVDLYREAADAFASAAAGDAKEAARVLEYQAQQRLYAYTSRGKGRGTASKRFGNYSNNPHAFQGKREMARRVRQRKKGMIA